MKLPAVPFLDRVFWQGRMITGKSGRPNRPKEARRFAGSFISMILLMDLQPEEFCLARTWIDPLGRHLGGEVNHIASVYSVKCLFHL